MKLTGALPSPITDEDRARDFHASALFGASTPDAPGSIDVTDAHTFRTQGGNSCVAYAHATSIQDLAFIRGKSLPLLSAQKLWADTRIRQGFLQPGVGILNTGTACGVALAEFIERGVIAESAFPDIPTNQTRVPPLGAFESKVFAKATNAHRILFESAADPVATLRSGIVAALQLAKNGKAAPPTACMTVDDAYGNLPDGQVYAATGGNVWGGHCQLITRYDAGLDAIGFASTWGGLRIFLVSLAWFAKFGAAAFVIEDYSTP